MSVIRGAAVEERAISRRLTLKQQLLVESYRSTGKLKETAPGRAEFGVQTVSRGVCALEYFPYHSRKFAHHRLSVPSQAFTFELLRAAIDREAAIFITRGQVIWEEAVPALHGYSRSFRTRSVQNVVISPRNCREGYKAALAALDDLETGSSHPLC